MAQDAVELNINPSVQVLHLLAEPQHVNKAVLGAQEAAMMVWALAVLHELNPTIWTALLDVIAAAPKESLDEVALTAYVAIHKSMQYLLHRFRLFLHRLYRVCVLAVTVLLRV